MSRIAYVAGRYVPHCEGSVSIDDRGLLFADSVYEVCEILDGRLVDADAHIRRLGRSLAALSMPWPVSAAALPRILREVVARNRVRDGAVYLQVTRGATRRDFLYSPYALAPTLIVTAHAIDRAAGEAQAAAGIAVISMPDIRWARVDIKTTGLLPNVLAKEAARTKGAREAWFVAEDGTVTEGASSNAWIVTREGRLVTRPAAGGILGGVTRATLIRLIEAEGLPFEDRAFTIAEAQAASEAFNSAATALVMPVVAIDGQQVGSGRPGPVATGLRARFHRHATLV